MTIICEECGKIYHIPQEKVTQLQNSKDKVRCTECGFVFSVTASALPEIQPPAKSVMTPPPQEPPPPTPSAPASVEPASEPAPKREARGARRRTTAPKAATKVKGIGVRGKMMILFLVIPVILMGVSGYLSQRQLKSLAGHINEESIAAVRSLGEENIINIAKSVSRQVQIYLKAHPELKKEHFYDNEEFRQIALQRVGQTGYTVLIEFAPKDEDWTIWVHEVPMLIGIPAYSVLKEALGEFWPQFYEILVGIKTADEVHGYYNWREEDGSIREKFMSMVKIPGTNFGFMATTYIDEFTGRIKKLEAHSNRLTIQSRNISLGILFGTIIIISLCIIIYGNRIARTINYLTDAADRISVGELDAEIVITSHDEFGNLAEAISRMQDSLRLSLARLRRRR